MLIDLCVTARPHSQMRGPQSLGHPLTRTVLTSIARSRTPIDDQQLTNHHQPSTIDNQPTTINHQPLTNHHQQSTINNQPTTINNRQSTINQPPSTIDQPPSFSQRNEYRVAHFSFTVFIRGLVHDSAVEEHSRGAATIKIHRVGCTYG